MIGLIAKPWNKTVSQTGVSAGLDFHASFPASNCLNNDYGRVARLNGNLAAPNNQAYILFDLGSPKSVDTIALLWHNGRSTDTIYVTGGSTVARALSGADFATDYSPAITGTTTRTPAPGLSKFIKTLAVPQVWRYWLILFNATDAMTAPLQFSRVFIGKGAQFAIGPQKAILSAKDMNASVQTEVGETRQQEDTGLIRPIVSLSLDYAKQSEMEQVLGQYTLGLGVSKPLMVCTDLTSAYIQDNLAFGRPEKIMSLESDTYDKWSFEALVTSLGV